MGDGAWIGFARPPYSPSSTRTFPTCGTSFGAT